MWDHASVNPYIVPIFIWLQRKVGVFLLDTVHIAHIHIFSQNYYDDVFAVVNIHEMGA